MGQYASTVTSMSPVTSLTVFFLLLGSVWWFIQLLRRWTAAGPKLPPGPTGLPIIGNLHMLGTLPHRTLQDLSKKYGPIMSLRLGSITTIVVSSPAAAELVMKTHDGIFASRPKLQSGEFISYGRKGMALTEYGAYWRSVRKFCTMELLTMGKIEGLAGMRRELLDGCVEDIKGSAAGREAVNVSEKVSELMEELVYKMLFGRSKDERFDLKGTIKEAMFMTGAFNIADFVPALAPFDLQGLSRGLKATAKAVDKILEFIIDEHERDASNKTQRRDRDFVDVMLSMKDKRIYPNDDFTIDRTNIKAIVLDMIVGSIGTSNTAVEWTMCELIRHPRVMKKLQSELKDVVGDDEIVKETHLPKLLYLEMVIKESFRLHPVAPLLVPRESMADIVINDYYIPKKSRIIINSWAIGRACDVWSENVDEFFPERFESSDIDVYGRYFELTPFGSGRRGCPGMNLGLAIVRLVLANLVHSFDWTLPSGMSLEDFDMSEKFGLSMPKAKPLIAMPTYRF